MTNVETLPVEQAPVAVRGGGVRRLWRTPGGLIGSMIVGVLLVVSVLAALGLTPYPPL